MSDVLAGAAWGAVTVFLYFGCWNLAAVVMPREDLYQKTLHAIVLCWAVIVAAAVVLGAVNQLTPPPLLAAVLLASFGLFAAARFLARAPAFRQAPVSADPRGGADPDPSQGETAKFVEAALWLFLLSFWVCHVVRNGLLQFPDDFDSLMYHLPLIDHWLQARSLYAPDAWQWSTPGNNELLGLWCVAPFSGDFLAALTNAPAALLLALAARELASLLGLGGLRASVCAAAVAANYVVLKQLVDAENDVAVAAATLASAAYALRFARSGRLADLALGGICIGLLAGVKFYALGDAAVVWLVLVAAVAVCRGPRAAAKAGLTAGALALCWGGYWYTRNGLLTGSPLFPKGLFAAGDDLARYYPEAARSSFVGNGSPELLSLAVEAVWKMAGPLHVAALCCLPAAAAWLFASGLGLLRAPGGRYRGVARLGVACLAVGAGVVLVCTPFAVEDVPGTLNQLKWAYAPVRYGVTFLSLSVIVFVVPFTDLAGAATHLRLWKRPPLVPKEAPGRPGWWGSLVFRCVGAAPSLALLAVAAYQLTTGLPKFKEDTAELILLAADGMLLAVVVLWAGARLWRRPRLAAFVVGVAVTFGSAAAAGPLSGRWHSGFAAFYDRMFEPGLFTALDGPGRKSECICVLDFRPYPFFGSKRQHHVCQPHRPRDAAAFYDYLLAHRVTLVAARFDSELRTRGWEFCRSYIAANADLLTPAKGTVWSYALYRVRMPAEEEDNSDPRTK